MLEEDVLVGRSRKRRYSHAEMSQADLEATITGTQLACLMASGETAVYIHTCSSWPASWPQVRQLCIYIHVVAGLPHGLR